MAEAAVGKTELFKGIRWYDGFVVALANPGFLIGSLGYSIGALGGWGAVLLWSISMLMGVGKNWIYAEMASMFPDKPGGIALYAHEGWRRYFSLAGVVASSASTSMRGPGCRSTTTTPCSSISGGTRAPPRWRGRVRH